MKCLTESEARQWFDECYATTGIKVDSDYPDLYHDNQTADILLLPYPSTPLQATYYAHLAGTVGLDDKDEFEGALFWLTRWNLGPTSPVGWKLLERLRTGLGETRPLDIAPVQSFRRDELADLSVFALATFTFGWSAFIVPFWPNDLFIYIDHKDRWCIVTKTAEIRQTIEKNLSSLSIEPCKEDRFGWRERFCRYPS
jgi:hypothetical protein